MSTESLSFQKIIRWTDDECRAYYERLRWPNGPVCPHCGGVEPYKITRKTRTKNVLKTIYKCRACRKQFTVTVGTIFEDSHIPLSKWFAAIMLMCSSKKSISAHQLHRLLEISYPSAWYMCHRVREAMADKTPFPLEGVVEADATFLGGKVRRGHPVYHERIQDEISLGLRRKDGSLKAGPRKGQPHPRTLKAPVLGMVERGGKVRTFALNANDETASEIRPLLRANLAPTAHLITDAHGAYRAIKKYVRHDSVNHQVEYVNADRPDIHTQNIEGYWSLMKRAVIGAYHHVNRGYLPMYLSEWQFRWNARHASDVERFEALAAQTQGRLTWYQKDA